MATGTITRVIGDRGFGFIRKDSGEGDIFVHHSALPAGEFDQLQEGDAVEYEEASDPKSGKTRAVNVQRV